jgi:putative DNA primase/helicase
MRAAWRAGTLAMSAEFLSACTRAGITIPNLIPDGKLRRVPTADHPRKRNGAVVWFGSGGWAMNWETGEEVRTGGGTDCRLTDAERAEMRRVRDMAAAQLRQLQARAARIAEDVIRRSSTAEHPYLLRKGVCKGRGLVASPAAVEEYRLGDPAVPMLVIPMRHHISNALVGLQRIAWDAESDGFSKLMIRGTRADGAVYRIGTHGRRVYVEGYATGHSVKAGCPDRSVVVCFSAGNLERVALADGRPGDIVFADNDKSGRGEQAAKASGLPYVMAPEVGDDANDWQRAMGAWAVAAMVRGCR